MIVSSLILMVQAAVARTTTSPITLSATTLTQVLKDPLGHADVWIAAATIAQLAVIFATALFAVLQVYHVRAGNQLAVLRELNTVTQNDAFFKAQLFIYYQLPEAMQDQEFRYQVEHFHCAAETTREAIRNVSVVGNVYEDLGRLVRHNFVSPRLVFETWSPAIVGDWDNLQDLIVLQRRQAGKHLWEHFEYLSVCAKSWLDEHRDGTIGPRWRHEILKDNWRDIDLQYAAGKERPKKTAETTPPSPA